MLTRRTYIIFLSLVILWCGLIVAAPLLAGSSGLSEFSLFIYRFFSRICHQIDARSFHLEGHKFAVCIRCSSIYFSFLISLLFYPFIQTRREQSIPSKWILISALIPICLDAALNFLGMHASTSISRAVTGGIAGLVLPFYILPPLAEAVTKIWRRRSLIHPAAPSSAPTSQ